MVLEFEATVKQKDGYAGFPDLFILNTTDKRLLPLVGHRVIVNIEVVKK